MSLKYALYSPSGQVVVKGENLEPTAANNRVNRTLRGLQIFADGVVEIVDTNGNTWTRTFSGVAPFVEWRIQIAMVTNNTTVLVTDLIGLR